MRTEETMLRKLFSKTGLFIILGAIVGLLLTPVVMSSFVDTGDTSTVKKVKKTTLTLKRSYPPLPPQVKGPLFGKTQLSTRFYKEYKILSKEIKSELRTKFATKFKECMVIGITFFEKQGEKPHIKSLREGCFDESYAFIEQQI